MPRRLAFFVLMLLLSPIWAADDFSIALQPAQQALAAGDYDKAYPLYLSAAQAGNPLAQFSVALFHRQGWGQQPKDAAEACRWFGRSAEGAIPAAAHFYGECLDAEQPSQAAHWYQQAGELGHAISWCHLADLYMQGRGVPRDPARGLSLCQQAAQTGAIPASLRVGLYLLQGESEIRDPAAAHQWFEQVPDLPEAQYWLGVQHRDGLGVQADAAEALQWFERAAAQGYLPAYLPTAELYYGETSDIAQRKPPAPILAKAYLWLTATVQRADSAETRARADALRGKVLSIMPSTWQVALDARVAEHLAQVAHPVP